MDRDTFAFEKHRYPFEFEIEKSSAVVVVLTPEALRSTWVRREIALAEELGKPIFAITLSGNVIGPFAGEMGKLEFFQPEYEGIRLPGEDFYERLMSLIQERRDKSVYRSEHFAASPLQMLEMLHAPAQAQVISPPESSSAAASGVLGAAKQLFLSDFQNSSLLYSLAAACASVALVMVVWLFSAPINDALFLAVARFAALGAGLVVFLLIMRRFLMLQSASKEHLMQAIRERNQTLFEQLDREIVTLLPHETSG